MTIESTLIFDEVNRIINSGQNPVHFFYEAVIHVRDNDYPLAFFSAKKLDRNYNEDYWDTLQVYGKIGAGTLNVDIIPFESELEMTISRRVVVENSEEEIIGETVQHQRYRANLISQPKDNVKGSVSANLDKTSADLGGLVDVTFQLLDFGIEQLRSIATGGIFRNSKVGDVLRYLMGVESKQINVSREASVLGVDMVEADNQDVYNHVIVDHGVGLIDLPGYMQQKCGGIYNSRIGSYLQNGIWYIYPELNVERFSTTPKTLTVIIVPPNKYPGITRTYRETDNQLIVLSTRGVKHFDDSEQQQQNFGNGIRFTDARKIVEGFGVAEQNRYTVQRSQNNFELLMGERRTGINRAMLSDNPINANPFREYSKLTRTNCTHLQVTWEYSNEELIYPGMPVRVVYANQEDITEAYGNVLQCQHLTMSAGESQLARRHTTVSTLTLILKKTV